MVSDVPSLQYSPACPGLPSWVKRVDPAAAATWVTVSVHRCGGRSREEEEPEHCGAVRVPRRRRRRRRVQALPASGSGPRRPRLLKAPASAPAPPLALRPDAQQSRAISRRPEALGSLEDRQGGQERSGVGFGFCVLMGVGGVRFGTAPSAALGWLLGGGGEGTGRVWVRRRVRGAPPRRRERSRGSSWHRPHLEVIFLPLRGARPRTLAPRAAGTRSGGGGGAGAGPGGPGRGRTHGRPQAEPGSAAATERDRTAAAECR